MTRYVWLGLVLVLAAACAAPSPAPGDPDQTVSAVQVEIHVQAVEARQVGYDPAQVEVAVEGAVGDSCNQLSGVRQEREGDAINVTITAIRTEGIPCMELAQLYSETIRLEGEFAPGDYTVTVNGVSEAFTVVSRLGDAEVVARTRLAADLGVEEAALTLISIEVVFWGDRSLGCPEPGQVYLQVLVPGYRLVFEHVGQRYEVHTDRDGTPAVTC